MKKLLKSFESLLAVTIIFILIFIFCGYSNLEIFLFDLFSHFYVQYFIISLLALIIFSFRFKKFFASLALLSSILSFLSIAPYLFDNTERIADLLTKGVKLKFMVANLLTSNKNYQKAIELFLKNDPDFLVVIELNELWERQLESLKTNYPYSKSLPRPDNFGIAFFSKYPLEEIQIASLKPGMTPTIIAKANIKGRLISVIGAHPLPPVRLNLYKERNRLISHLGELSAKANEPLVLLGDLNTTMWSTTFKKLLENSRLKDTRKEIGIVPTWPTQIKPLLIPLEHILVTTEWQVLSLYSVPIDGSDHHGLVLEANLY